MGRGDGTGEEEGAVEVAGPSSLCSQSSSLHGIVLPAIALPAGTWAEDGCGFAHTPAAHRPPSTVHRPPPPAHCPPPTALRHAPLLLVQRLMTKWMRSSGGCVLGRRPRRRRRRQHPPPCRHDSLAEVRLPLGKQPNTTQDWSHAPLLWSCALLKCILNPAKRDMPCSRHTAPRITRPLLDYETR
jgi:hypothetical protein